MQGVIIVLLAALFLLIGAGFYFMFFKKESSGPGKDTVAAPSASIVKVRDAISDGNTVRFIAEMSQDDFDGMQGGETFVIPNSDEYDLEETDIERLRKPSTPYEEKCEIARMLRKLGYHVNFPREGEDDGDGKQSDDVDSISVETDVDVLRAILTNPYSSLEKTEAAKRRLEELESGGDSDREGGDDDVESGDDSEGGEPQGSGDDGYDDGDEGYEAPDAVEDYGAEFIEPSEQMYAEEPEPEGEPDCGSSVMEKTAAEEPYDYEKDIFGPENETPEQQAEVSKQEAAQNQETAKERSSDSYLEFTKGDGFVDNAETEKLFKLLFFIIRSYKKGFIDPELVAFTEEKYHVNINKSDWSPAEIRRAEARKNVYLRNSVMKDMPLNEYAAYIHSNVMEAEADKAQENTQENAASPSVEQPPVPVQGSVSPFVNEERSESKEEVTPSLGKGLLKHPEVKMTRPLSVTANLDFKGGRHDIMWKRVSLAES